MQMLLQPKLILKILAPYPHNNDRRIETIIAHLSFVLSPFIHANNIIIYYNIILYVL
jgi:hypothetical protein